MTRLHPVLAGSLRVYANDEEIATHIVPQQPGTAWKVYTLIQQPEGETIRVRFEPMMETYVPMAHAIYAGDWLTDLPDTPILADYGNFALYDVALNLDGGRSTGIAVNLPGEQRNIPSVVPVPIVLGIYPR
ncbi:MAG: phosphodiester glycosidase family protein [Chloroflexi bacterium]|nr:phosphodiester glycosidase family protein [Chloroflexota bacterium]